MYREPALVKCSRIWCMEVQRASSRSCSRLYRQKFEDRSLAHTEKRRKAGSGFEAGLSDLGDVLIPSRVI
ncbi:hypothetical protein SLEP1_g22569 [Rubroshorea leprosula]|uniref:Uncharacterized protein n=1 Tax=Rubroshorea leprosula TaxID=152421 RepID=A0AAV5J9K6_9ROSI|nr:hypothetical protein SLEP1_g22569 [Rubroshorea leprosula]